MIHPLCSFKIDVKYGLYTIDYYLRKIYVYTNYHNTLYD